MLLAQPNRLDFLDLYADQKAFPMMKMMAMMVTAVDFSDTRFVLVIAAL